MGQVKITGGGPTGLYDIEILQPLDKAAARQADIAAHLVLYDTKYIPEAATATLTARSAVAAAASALSTAPPAAVQSCRSALLRAQEALEASIRKSAALLLSKEALKKEQDMLTKATEVVARTGVWCADLTEVLAAGSTAGTIEVNGVDSQIIIRPRGSVTESTGIIQHVGLNKATGTFVNLALLAAWQKYKPTCRIGVLTTVDTAGNTCALNLVSALSSVQSLDINRETSLSNVPIVYMDCNAEVFNPGDRVVVEFINQSWATPRVIGFEDHPVGPGGVALPAADYFVFTTSGIKLVNIGSGGVKLLASRSNADAYHGNSAGTPVTWFSKRFMHDVGTTGTRELYFIATSLWLNPQPFVGGAAFFAANPSHPLVTNTASTQITSTAQVLTDLNHVNEEVNHAHTYVSDPVGNDNWRFMGVGESGDCEDFALTKAQKLLDMGYPASAIHLEGGVVEANVIGHAWLVVQTTIGDFALDTKSDRVVANASLTNALGLAYTGRRRQIGMNWAFVDSWGWVLSSSQQQDALWTTCWYILDPLLNIFYEMFPGQTTTTPFYGAADLLGNWVISHPSVNFSDDNATIYTAINGWVQGFHLGDNALENRVVGPYSGLGYVDTDGNVIIADESGTKEWWFGYPRDKVLVTEFEDIPGIHLYFIHDTLLGDFKALYDVRVSDEDGCYGYEYHYAEGTFTAEYSVPANPEIITRTEPNSQYRRNYTYTTTRTNILSGSQKNWVDSGHYRFEWYHIITSSPEAWGWTWVEGDIDGGTGTGLADYHLKIEWTDPEEPDFQVYQESTVSFENVPYNPDTGTGGGYEVSSCVTAPAISKAKTACPVGMDDTYDPNICLLFEDTTGELHKYPYTFTSENSDRTYVAYDTTLDCYAINPEKPDNILFRWMDFSIGTAKVAGFVINGSSGLIKKVFRGGSPYLGTLAAALGTSESAILGLAYVPSTNRLNP